MASDTQKHASPAQPFDVVVIGGGPAGMMAAARAAGQGSRVLLLEKNATLGKKLLISGGGRSNVTNNTPDIRTILARYKEGGKFLFSAFAQFAVSDSIHYFTSRGLPLREENEGRLFPDTNRAQSVHDVLTTHMKEGGVTVRTSAPVTGISYDRAQKKFTIFLSHERITVPKVIVGTGGTSHPETGSTGEGYSWLRSLGHTVVDNNYALVPIALHDAWVASVSGITLTDIKLTLFGDGKKKEVREGKMLFTHVGVSGPTILNMSKHVGEVLSECSEVVLMIDLFPAFDHRELRNMLTKLLGETPNKMLKNTLRAHIPTALAHPLITLIAADGDMPNHSVSKEVRTKLTMLLKALPLHPSHLLGSDKAIISSGGVTLEEVDFRTMESRKIPGLYLIGDVLNIDRPSGGYSLQVCWTTGFVAGTHASNDD
jgi:predicted Rossmann fold flavoprotein